MHLVTLTLKGTHSIQQLHGAGNPSHTIKHAWNVRIMILEPAVKRWCNKRSSIETFIERNCRYSHQLICTRLHSATSVSVTIATHCYPLLSRKDLQMSSLFSLFFIPLSYIIFRGDNLIIFHFHSRSAIVPYKEVVTERLQGLCMYRTIILRDPLGAL